METYNSELLFIKGIIEGFKLSGKPPKFVQDEIEMYLDRRGLNLSEVNDFVKNNIKYENIR